MEVNKMKTKPKPASRKSGGLKVALTFKKTSTASSLCNGSTTEAESIKSINNKNFKIRRMKSPSKLQSTPPLYSSTPKPMRKTVSLPTLPDSTVAASAMEKDVRIVLDRSIVDEYMKNQQVFRKPAAKPRAARKSEPKATLPKKPGRPRAAKKIPTPPKEKKQLTSFRSFSQDPSLADVRSSVSEDFTQPRDAESHITTQIPSDILENFGIVAAQSPSRRCLAGPDTPPHTSPASSSYRAADRFTSDAASTGSDHSSEFHFPEAQFETGLASTSLIIPNSYIPHISSTIQDDPLETISPAVNGAMGPITNHCDLNYGLNERLYKSPKLYHLEELAYCSVDIRRTAPYALKINPREEKFFLFAAPISRTHNKYCCQIFGVVNSHLVAYGGHFMIPKERLYDPITKAPVDDIVITSHAEIRQHLLLFNTPNKTLLGFEDYYPQASHPSYVETQLSSLETYMASISQVELKEKTRSEIVRELMESELRTLRTLKTIEPSQSSAQTNIRRTISVLTEPRTEQVFWNTNLLINADSLKRIMKAACPINEVKAKYGGAGSFQISCAMDTSFQTAYYAAYEEAGCMAFFPTVFVLGRLGDRYVVGVVNGNTFFIMATRRLFSRFTPLSPNVQPVEFDMEMLESVHLPFAVPFQQAFTMLEARQILRNPHKYGQEHAYLAKALGIVDGIRPMAPSSSWSCPESTKNEEEKKHWLHKMVCLNFSKAFYDSLIKFPDAAANPDNLQLFGENVTKLWVHQMLRLAHGKENNSSNKSHSTSPKHISVEQFFSMDVDAFVSHYLPFFGVPSDFQFRCLCLGVDGLPVGICADSLTVSSIGQHVQKCHTQPLMLPGSGDHQLEFIPFSLVPQHQRKREMPSNTGDSELLAWARATVERYRYHPYMKVLELANSKPSSGRNGLKRSSSGDSGKGHELAQPPLHKKTRVAEETDDD